MENGKWPMENNDMTKFHKLLFFPYILSLFALFLYSFTQIDLSLTFSRIEALRNIVTSFQYIGYFDRPLSTYLFLFLITVLYIFYFVFLKLSYKKKLAKKFVWTLLGTATVILAFSYNAFSYDLFNYMFDAKIVTHYGQNPYEHKALDFPGDPMLSFMHWTHRVYPYGPVWLVLTVPLSFIGFNFFLPTFFLFKFLCAGAFFGSLYFIGKIFQKISPENETAGLVFFGLNPFILIESLVSAHIDIVMIFFVLWSFYLLIEKKHFLSIVLLAISVGIKFATLALLPVYIMVYFMQRRKSIPWEHVFLLSIILLLTTVYYATMRTNFQPWYLLLPLSFTVFLAKRFYILIPVSVISFTALLNYVPFLYTGNWDPPIPQILSNINMASYVISFVAIVVYYLLIKRQAGK